jgi:LPS sulfotransferase NodH
MPISTRNAIFFGWTLEELEALLAQFKTQLSTYGSDYITSASLAGKSTQIAERMKIRDWLKHLRKALRELDPDTYGTPSSRFVASQVEAGFEK